MAEARFNSVMLDLQNQLKTANVQVANLSTIAQKGDDKLVEKFISESIFVKSGDRAQLASEGREAVLQSQLYIACFWGFRDVVKGILALSEEQGIDMSVNHQNKGTLWTPLHAATFQEHGPIIMLLLDNGAQPELPDSEGRTPKDFASASDKVWGHFAALDLPRTPKSRLVDMGIIKKIHAENISVPHGSAQPASRGLRMAAYNRPDSAYEYNNDPFVTAAVTGDVLANDEEGGLQNRQPQFSIYK